MTKPYTVAVSQRQALELFANASDCLHCLVSEVLIAWQQAKPDTCTRHMLLDLTQVIADIVNSAPGDLRAELRQLAIAAVTQVIDQRHENRDAKIVIQTRPH